MAIWFAICAVSLLLAMLMLLGFFLSHLRKKYLNWSFFGYLYFDLLHPNKSKTIQALFKPTEEN